MTATREASLFVAVALVSAMPKELAYLACVFAGAAVYLLFLVLQPSMGRALLDKPCLEPKLPGSRGAAELEVDAGVDPTAHAVRTREEGAETSAKFDEASARRMARFRDFKKHVLEHLGENEDIVADTAVAALDASPPAADAATGSRMRADAAPFVFPSAPAAYPTFAPASAGAAICAVGTTKLSAAAAPFVRACDREPEDAAGPLQPAPAAGCSGAPAAAKPYFIVTRQDAAPHYQPLTTVSRGSCPRGAQCRWAHPVPTAATGPPGVWNGAAGSPTAKLGHWVDPAAVWAA